MRRSNVLLVFLPALVLAGLLLPATHSGARAQQQRPLGRLVLPEGPHVHVTGSVVEPGWYPFKASLTVTQALAAGGGLRGDANKDCVRVFRTPADSVYPTIIAVDLKAIRKRRAPDFTLQPYDFVHAVGRSMKRCLGTSPETLKNHRVIEPPQTR